MPNNKNNITYGDHGLPTYGVIYNRNLDFINANINQKHNTVSVKNLINPRSCQKNSFGNSPIWYPNMYIDLNYNPNYGGYVNANGPNGPYYALGLGNYPRGMYKELFFGKSSKTKSSKTKSSKTKSPKRKTKITYCLPKEKKFPVNTKKRCSAALSYARYAPDPCKIAECVKKNCKKYPTVGKTSKLMKKCENKKKK